MRVDIPACQANKVRILWEPWPEGPNIATGPVGYEALFRAFGNSPYIGLQYDPSHLVRQFMDEIQTARDYADRIFDVHLKDTEILWPVLRKGGIRPVDNAGWWRYRLPGFGSINWPSFFTVLMDSGYQGAMNIEHEDPLYGYPFEGDQFPAAYETGFRVAHSYLKQYLPAQVVSDCPCKRGASDNTAQLIDSGRHRMTGGTWMGIGSAKRA